MIAAANGHRSHHAASLSAAFTALCGAVLLLAAAACGDSAGAPRKALLFTAIPNQDETLLRQKFAPIADYLAGKLGVPVEYVHSTKYPDSIELFKNGDVQLAWFGGLTGVQARHAVAGARAIAQGEEDRAFRTYFIAHKDSGLEPGESFPAALAGKKFTFGAEQSTSGRLMPEHFIRDATGRAPEAFFGMPNHYAESHDQTCELVQSGAFAAGAVDYTVYERRVREGKTDPDVCRVIWKTPTYPDYNFTAHPELEARFGSGFTDKLQQALLEMTDPALLSAFPRRKFVPARNEDFAQIEALAVALGFVRA